MGAKSPHSSKKDSTKVAASKLKSPKLGGKAEKAAMVDARAQKQNRLKTGLDGKLVNKAVEALLKFHEKQSEQNEKSLLLGNDRAVQVQFTLLRSPGDRSPKPVRILIPHPLFKLADGDDDDAMDEPEICLIVKEESKPWVQEMISKFPDHMGCVKKVLGLQSLRKKHAQYSQKRELLAKYNVFMADDRILPMLSKALGKEFFKAKKLPIPINLTRKESLPFTIQKALSATFMTISSGTCINVRAGHTGMSPKKIVENILEIANNAALKIPHKWANIQVISIKTPESVALPIYNKTPEILKELGKLAGMEDEEAENAIEQEDDKTGKKQEDGDDGKKREMKSPLLKALKKQKKEEKTKKAKKEESESEKSDDVESEEKVTPKSTKKKRSSSAGSTKETMETPEKKQKVESSKKKSKSNEKQSKKEEKTSSASKKKKSDKIDDDDKPKERFIAAKKFKKSIKGYVFKMGRDGLGYYIDEKPVVNKLAIEGILRMGKSGSRGGGGRKKKGRRSY